MKRILVVLLLMIGVGTAVHAQQDSTMQQYAGKYIFPQGSAVSEAMVNFESGVLSISSAIGSATLSKIETDRFSIVEYNGTAEFKRNDAGKIVSIHVVVADLDVTGTKESFAKFWNHRMILQKL